MQLRELLEKVDDRTLQKDDLEQYRDQLSKLYALMSLELADVEKEKALFIDGYEADSDIQKKRKWQVTHKGLREIELKNYMKGIVVVLSSLKARLYNTF